MKSSSRPSLLVESHRVRWPFETITKVALNYFVARYCLNISATAS